MADSVREIAKPGALHDEREIEAVVIERAVTD